MDEGQKFGVEGLPREHGLASVQHVPGQGMADIGKMDADLVGASRLQAAGNDAQIPAGIVADRLIAGNGLPARSGNPPFGRMMPVAADFFPQWSTVCF